MVKDSWLGMMVGCTKAVIRMIKNMELEHFCGQMVGSIMAIGKMESSMVLEYIFQ